ncbi:MAG TPA: cytochrome c peroxidase [Gammaproteobacteria bacterium]|nr:cytochrome c peroxidase [Gammaproteobacteria bacterium]
MSSSTSDGALRSLCLLLLIASWRAPLFAALPRVPEPPENPVTEAKRVLGKILFWDEQLSSDDSIACGTCHRPASGGADPRSGRHTGVDKGTIDDVHGSPGIVSLDREGRAIPNPIFADQPQVTPRLAPSIFGALWAEELSWDGRAGTQFLDPLTGEVLIARGGALENQSVSALINETEMAQLGRRWSEITAKLERSKPLALATELPDDVAAALDARPRYADLFASAFGDAAITPAQIAFALASYQRTLVSDQTDWDRYQAGDTSALNESALYGWRKLQSFHCTSCHEPPLFTNNDFAHIGLRRAEYDRGRELVTNDPEDAGEMKVPSLRNVGLRVRFMHTGEFTNLGAAIGFYVNAPALPERDGIPGGGLYAFNMSRIDETDIREFLGKALTDPRVRDETFPFDRPRLQSERTEPADPL